MSAPTTAVALLLLNLVVYQLAAVPRLI